MTYLSTRKQQTVVCVQDAHALRHVSLMHMVCSPGTEGFSLHAEAEVCTSAVAVTGLDCQPLRGRLFSGWRGILWLSVEGPTRHVLVSIREAVNAAAPAGTVFPVMPGCAVMRDTPHQDHALSAHRLYLPPPHSLCLQRRRACINMLSAQCNNNIISLRWCCKASYICWH